MFILHSKTHGYLKSVTEEGMVFTEIREGAMVFGMMYQVALLYTTIGKEQFPDDMAAEPVTTPTYH